MSEHDPVNNPRHYDLGGIQPIDAIEAWRLGFNLGNAVKYIARAGKKDPAKTVEDLEKSRWYLDREIAKLRAEESKASPADDAPAFKVGDQVEFSVEDEFPASGVVRGVKSIKSVDRDSPCYTVDWKEQDGFKWSDDHWGHELRLRGPEPADGAPAFKVGDRVRRDGESAIAVVEDVSDLGLLFIRFPGGATSYVNPKDAVHASK